MLISVLCQRKLNDWRIQCLDLDVLYTEEADALRDIGLGTVGHKHRKGYSGQHGEFPLVSIVSHSRHLNKIEETWYSCKCSRLAFGDVYLKYLFSN